MYSRDTVFNKHYSQASFATRHADANLFREFTPKNPSRTVKCFFNFKAFTLLRASALASRTIGLRPCCITLRKEIVVLRKRNNNVSFRLSDDEKQLFDNLQQITGLPKNRLIIDLLLDAQLAPKEYTSEVKKLNQLTANLSEQVKRIGVNVNQLARVANSTGNISDIVTIETFNKNLLSLQRECDNLWRYTNRSIQKML